MGVVYEMVLGIASVAGELVKMFFFSGPVVAVGATMALLLARVRAR